MKVAVILNSLSGKKKFFYSTLLPVIQQQGEAVVFETHSPTDAFEFSVKAVSEKYELLIAAGGDGTIHQVVNGMLSTNLSIDQLPMLSILPVGSGNDFARTVNIMLDPVALRKRLTELSSRMIDVGLVHFQKQNDEIASAYFINVASAGMGPEVLKIMSSGKKQLGSAVAYYVAFWLPFYPIGAYRLPLKRPPGNGAVS